MFKSLFEKMIFLNFELEGILLIKYYKAKIIDFKKKLNKIP